MSLKKISRGRIEVHYCFCHNFNGESLIWSYSMHRKLACFFKACQLLISTRNLQSEKLVRVELIGLIDG